MGIKITGDDFSLDELVGESIASLALDFTSLVILATPKKSGVAQANWNVSTTGDEPSYKKSKTSANSAIARASTMLNGKHGCDLEVIVSNSTPYIVPLNEGHSQQAGEHFIERCLALAEIDSDLGD